MNDLKSRQQVTVGSEWARIDRLHQTVKVLYANEDRVFVEYTSDKAPTKRNDLSMGYFLENYTKSLA